MTKKSQANRSSSRSRRKPSFTQMMSMRGHYRSYQKARAFVRALKLNSYQEWLRYCQGKLKGKKPKPLDIPQNPRDTYLNKGWTGFPDWLGNENISYRLHTWRAFPKARAFVRKLKLASNRQWRAYVRGDMTNKPRLPRDIPTNPNYVYAKREWKGWRDWLGTK